MQKATQLMQLARSVCRKHRKRTYVCMLIPDGPVLRSLKRRLETRVTERLTALSLQIIYPMKIF